MLPLKQAPCSVYMDMPRSHLASEKEASIDAQSSIGDVPHEPFVGTCLLSEAGRHGEESDCHGDR
jgi:hypothetical protein